MRGLLLAATKYLSPDQIWVNPDCGLKTRRWEEVRPALANMVRAAQGFFRLVNIIPGPIGIFRRAAIEAFHAHTSAIDGDAATRAAAAAGLGRLAADRDPKVRLEARRALAVVGAVGTEALADVLTSGGELDLVGLLDVLPRLGRGPDRGALSVAIRTRLTVFPSGSISDSGEAWILGLELEEELVFVLRQRTMDLQQQLAVNQQGVLATAIIVRNNRELVRGVDRALDVTISALQVAVAVAMAVAHQKVVLDKVEALNRTTSDMIAGTAERLKTQGTQIHQQAASTMLDMESLKSAFADINIALDEISRYRREALPQMAQTIVEMDSLTTEAEKTIEQYERSTSAAGMLQLEVGPAAGEEAAGTGSSGS